MTPTSFPNPALRLASATATAFLRKCPNELLLNVFYTFFVEIR
jgi:hypothetical protein